MDKWTSHIIFCWKSKWTNKNWRSTSSRFWRRFSFLSSHSNSTFRWSHQRICTCMAIACSNPYRFTCSSFSEVICWNFQKEKSQQQQQNHFRFLFQRKMFSYWTKISRSDRFRSNRFDIGSSSSSIDFGFHCSNDPNNSNFLRLFLFIMIQIQIVYR